MRNFLFSMLIIFGCIVLSGCPGDADGSCAQDAGICAAGTVCNLESGLCEPDAVDSCVGTSLCGPGTMCDEILGRCVADAADCRTNGDLCLPGTSCDSVTGQCRADAIDCSRDEAVCDAGTVCDPETGKCVIEPETPECTNDEDCDARCWDGVCGPVCRGDGDCGADERCYDSVCVPEDTHDCGSLTPDWRDQVIYYVMVDRFLNSDGVAHPVPGATGDNGFGASGQIEGGDLDGVTAKLDYLSDLGVTTLVISSPEYNRDLPGASEDFLADPNMYAAYHGRWPSPEAIDFADSEAPHSAPRVEDRIGGMDSLRDLIEAAHARGMKLMFEHTANHVDIESGLFAAKAGEGWFGMDDGRVVSCRNDIVCDGPCEGHPEWGTKCALTDYLPAFDYSNPAALEWSIQNAVWWVEELGLDGLKLHGIRLLPENWVTELRSALAHLERPILLLGEGGAYHDGDEFAPWIDPESMLDGRLDHPLKIRICEAIFRQGDLNALADFVVENDYHYGPDARMSPWLGNPEVPRPIHWASGEFDDCMQGSTATNGWTSQFLQPSQREPYRRLSVAYAIMMTGPGLPFIFYGDEVGLAGGGSPDNHRTMPWTGLNTHQIELRDRLRELLRLRQENMVLSRGKRTTVEVDPAEGWWVYRVHGCGSDAPSVLVAVNRDEVPRSVPIPDGAYVDLRTTSTIMGGSAVVPALDYLILREISD